MHGDLGPEHILARIEEPAVVAGVIDFGDMQIGPPAWDLVFLYEDYGAEFMEVFLRHFCAERRESLLREMFYLYQLDAVAWVIGEIERKGFYNAKEAISNLDRLRVETEAKPWQMLY